MALPTLSPLAYRRVTGAALASLVVIIVTGAAVRLTGSGLGCTDWPTCEEGQLAPAEITDAPAMIEFVNRTFTGVVSVAVVLAVLGSLRRRPRRGDLTWLSIGLVAGVVAQVVVGGLVVLLELSPRLVMVHFLLSMVLVANAVVLHHRAGHDDHAAAPIRHAPAGLSGLMVLLVAATIVVVTTGTVVTASGPHAGDDRAVRLGFNVADVARLHGISVVLLVTLAVATYAVVSSTPGADYLRRAVAWFLVVLGAQAAIGYVQYLTGVPALLVGIHVLGAVAVWISVLRVTLTTPI